jgi:hypothetical protein
MVFIERRVLTEDDWGLPAYNDADGRTVEEVLDLFERAAVQAEVLEAAEATL